jgi:hypothetical protein
MDEFGAVQAAHGSGANIRGGFVSPDGQAVRVTETTHRLRSTIGVCLLSGGRQTHAINRFPRGRSAYCRGQNQVAMNNE